MATPLVRNSLGLQGSARLSDVLFQSSAKRFGSLAALPSNVEAIEAGLLFANGLNAFVAIAGPSGWGKTHLLECISSHLATEIGSSVAAVPAEDWLYRPYRFEPSLPLLLDDVQDAMAKTRGRLQLRLALERRVRAGRPTILCFTSAKITRQIKGFLPSNREWVVAGMLDPQPAERQLIILQMSQAEGLVLSAALTKLIAGRMLGNGRTLLGALKRLKHYGSQWSDVHSTLRACGVLDPFFSDNPDWDLKERIVRFGEFVSSRFNEIPYQDLIAYMMLHEACICEGEVARACRMEPAEVYVRAARFSKRMRSCDVAQACVALYAETVIDGLLTN